MVEMADTLDSKSGAHSACGFKSHFGYHTDGAYPSRLISGALYLGNWCMRVQVPSPLPFFTSLLFSGAVVGA